MFITSVWADRMYPRECSMSCIMSCAWCNLMLAHYLRCGTSVDCGALVAVLSCQALQCLGSFSGMHRVLCVYLVPCVVLATTCSRLTGEGLIAVALNLSSHWIHMQLLEFEQTPCEPCGDVVPKHSGGTVQGRMRCVVLWSLEKETLVLLLFAGTFSTCALLCCVSGHCVVLCSCVVCVQGYLLISCF
jgi:hypothetical protein